MKYIPADKLIAEIERLEKNAWTSFQKGNSTEEQYYLRYGVIQDIISIITPLQQEQPKVDLDLEKVWDWIDKTFTETEIDSRYGESINVVMIEACKSDLRKKYERDFGLNTRNEE